MWNTRIGVITTKIMVIVLNVKTNVAKTKIVVQWNVVMTTAVGGRAENAKWRKNF